MTQPYERSNAVLRVRDLLCELADAKDGSDLQAFRERSRGLLRHFPERVHLHLSAALAPEIWGEPCSRTRN
jgi:hypothetical protein